MQIDIAVVTALAPTIFTGGLFVGFFMLKFITRAEATAMFERITTDMENRLEKVLAAQEKRFDAVWNNLDSIKNCLAGGPYQFDVRLVPRHEQTS